MDESSILKSIQERLESSLEPPKLGNQFLEDSALRDYIGMYLSEFGLDSSAEKKILETLVGLGDRVIDYAKDSQLAEMMPPTLQLFDAYGKKINKIHVPESMERLRKAALKEKIIADMYGLEQGVASRFVQMIKLYLFHASSGMWGGPMAVTDGAASLIKDEIARVESSGDQDASTQSYLAKIKECFKLLTSSNPDESWIAGQWTMEKEGHIEPIDRIQTIALPTAENRLYKLYGLKWYTATPQGDVSIALARIIDSTTKKPQERLSAFLVNIKGPEGQLKSGIDIIRLKDKLGTKTIPAAELALKGVEATLLAAPGEGVKILSSMTAVTRLYNAAAAISYARRVHVLCKDYSMRRTAFGKKLSEYPLQNGVLYDQEIRVRGCLALLLESSYLISLVELKKAKETEKAMNSILVLITKIFCAKESIKVISEGLEAFGGVGYLEDSGLPAFLRNTQVLMIWEGTTNVICLEFAKTLHAMGQNGLELIAQYLRYAIDMAYLHPSEILYEKQETFSPFQKVVYLYNALMPLLSHITDSKRKLGPTLLFSLREITFAFANLIIAVILLKQMTYIESPANVKTFVGWVERNEFPDIEKIRQLRQNPVAIDKDSGVIVFNDFAGRKNGGTVSRIKPQKTSATSADTSIFRVNVEKL